MRQNDEKKDSKKKKTVLSVAIGVVVVVVLYAFLDSLSGSALTGILSGFGGGSEGSGGLGIAGGVIIICLLFFSAVVGIPKLIVKSKENIDQKTTSTETPSNFVEEKVIQNNFTPIVNPQPRAKTKKYLFAKFLVGSILLALIAYFGALFGLSLSDTPVFYVSFEQKFGDGPKIDWGAKNIDPKTIIPGNGSPDGYSAG